MAIHVEKKHSMSNSGEKMTIISVFPFISDSSVVKEKEDGAVTHRSNLLFALVLHKQRTTENRTIPRGMVRRYGRPSDESGCYAILLMNLARPDFRLEALFLWMMLVFASLSSIFWTFG